MPREIMGTTVYTLKEAAEIFGVTERTMFLYLRDKRLTGQKIGGKWYFTEVTLKLFVRGDIGAALPPNLR